MSFLYKSIYLDKPIIANRALGEFSENPEKVIEELIVYTLNKLVS